jgi:hypothetical protein
VESTKNGRIRAQWASFLPSTQNFILEDKKLNLSIVLRQTGVLLRGFLQK